MLQTLADVLAELHLAKRLGGLHVVDMLQEGLVEALETGSHVRPRVDQESLADVLDCEDVLIGDVEFVETLSNDLIKIFVEKLSHAPDRGFKPQGFNVVLGEEAADS